MTPCPKSLLFLLWLLSAAGGALELSSEDFFSGTRLLRGHAGQVRAVAFSPGSQILASAGTDLTVRFWDLAAGKEKRQLQADRAVWSLAFSPDTRLLAAAGDAGVTIFDLKAAGERLTVQKGRRAWAAAFSPDSGYLAAAGDDGWVRLWDPRSGLPKGAFRAQDCTITSLAFSPDGKTLAAGAANKLIYLWDYKKRVPRAVLKGHHDWVWSLAYSPDGRTLASGSNDNTVRLWNAESGRELARLTGRSKRVLSVAFSPDGKTLASGSYDLVLLWDVASRRERASYTKHKDWVRSVAFSPDGKALASGSEDGTVMTLDLGALAPFAAIPASLAPARLTVYASVGPRWVLVTVTNAGAGPAYAVRLLPEGLTKGQGSLPAPEELGTIMPGRTLNKRLALPQEGLAGPFRLRITEGNGFDAKPLVVGR